MLGNNDLLDNREKSSDFIILFELSGTILEPAVSKQAWRQTPYCSWINMLQSNKATIILFASYTEIL